LELESELGLPRGHIFHGDLDFPYRTDDDPSPAARWGVRTGHRNVFLCGAGAVRGGGVSGIGGHNAAMAVLEITGRSTPTSD
jgi:phytoene dehydrogenase-like protein